MLEISKAASCSPSGRLAPKIQSLTSSGSAARPRMEPAAVLASGARAAGTRVPEQPRRTCAEKDVPQAQPPVAFGFSRLRFSCLRNLRTSLAASSVSATVTALVIGPASAARGVSAFTADLRDLWWSPRPSDKQTT